MNYGQSFEFREFLLKCLGFMMLVVATVLAVMIVAGWKIKFIEPNYCSGQQTISVGKASTFWEIAQREFPNSDPRAVTDELVKLNGTTNLDAALVKAPKSCKS